MAAKLVVSGGTITDSGTLDLTGGDAATAQVAFPDDAHWPRLDPQQFRRRPRLGNGG